MPYACAIKRKEAKRKSAIKHREKINERLASWREANRIRHRLMIKDWEKRNPSKLREKTARRRAKKLRATPKWLSPEDKFIISWLYYMAVELTKTGVNHEVDHILPLQGKNVSGLHVPINLQVIPKDVNRKKSNK